MRIAFAGTPEVAVPVLSALAKAGHEVAFVITRPDAPAGRGRNLTESPVAIAATELGLDVYKTTDLFSVQTQLQTVDCVIVVAFGAMIPAELLDAPKHGWINLHFSLLPQWRGAAPVQHAIKAGDDVTGVTAFRIDSGLDTGPILSSLATDIRPAETAGELLSRLATEGAGLIVATLASLEAGDLVPVAQPIEGISTAPKISTADARINWQSPALAISRLIRAVTPAPGAWTEIGEQRIKIGPVQLVAEVADLSPGQIELRAGKVLVGTGSHAIALQTVQQAGRNQVAASQWFANIGAATADANATEEAERNSDSSTGLQFS